MTSSVYSAEAAAPPSRSDGLSDGAARDSAREFAALEMLRGPRAGQRVPIVRDQIVLGRHASCDIVLPSTTVSRRHARILRRGEQYFLEDLGSLNGTYVNGRRVVGTVQLEPEDRIEIHEITLLFRRCTAPPESLATAATTAWQSSSMAGLGPLRRSKILHTAEVRVDAPFEAHPKAKLRAISELLRRLEGVLEVEPVVAAVLEGAFEVFPQTQRGYLLLPDAQSGELAIRGARHRAGESSPTYGPVSLGLVEHVCQQRQAVLSVDEELELPGGEESCVLDTGRRWTLCAPLLDSSRRALGVLYVETHHPQQRFREEDLEVLVHVAAVGGHALELARLHGTTLALCERRCQRALAQELQMHFLPQATPRLEGYRLAERFRPADEICGDYYGYVPLPDGRLAIALADVPGRGVSAALRMARLSAEIRTALLAEPDLPSVLARLHGEVLDPLLADQYVSVLLVQVDPRSDTLTLASAGYPPPLLRRAAGGAVEILSGAQSQPSLGLGEPTQYKQYVVRVEPGDRVLMYSDGLCEAGNLHDETYSVERIHRQFREASSLDGLLDGLLADMDRFSAGVARADDVVLITLERAAEP